LVIIDKKTRKVICVAFCNGKKHDFALYKESGIYVLKRIEIGADSGFQGIEKIHANSNTPRKSQKISRSQKKIKRTIATFPESVSATKMPLDS